MAKRPTEKLVRVKLNGHPVEIVEVEVKEAKRLIALGHAEPVAGAVERAVQVPRRHAMA